MKRQREAGPFGQARALLGMCQSCVKQRWVLSAEDRSLHKHLPKAPRLPSPLLASRQGTGVNGQHYTLN